jgi:hypothetical protein
MFFVAIMTSCGNHGASLRPSCRVALWKMTPLLGRCAGAAFHAKPAWRVNIVMRHENAWTLAFP